MNFSVLAQTEIVPESVDGWYRFENSTFSSNNPQALFDYFNEYFKIGESELDDIASMNNEGVITTIILDKLGYKHIYYQQKQSGVKVDEGWFHLQTLANSNTIGKGNGKIVSEDKLKSVNTVASINSAQAIDKSIDFMKNELNIETFVWEDNTGEYPKAELLITSNTASTFPSFSTVEYMPYVLAYKIPVYTSIPLGGEEVYVNAHNGQIIKHYALFTNLCENELYPDCEIDTEVSTHFGEVCIKTSFDTDNIYKLADKCRGYNTIPSNVVKGIYSRDPTKPYSNIFDLPNAVYTDDNNEWDSSLPIIKNAVSVHYVAEKSFDWFINMGVSQFIYDPGPLQVLSNSSLGTQSDAGAIIINTNHSTYIDAIAHEFTHTIEWNKEFPTNNNVEVNGAKESLGIEESFCDILGTYIERDVLQELNGSASLNYYIRGANRDMATYRFYTTDEDGNYNGPFKGEHSIAYFQNHWFYLLSKGGLGDRPQNSDGSSNGSYNICPIDDDVLREIVFRNFRYLLGGVINMYDARQGSLWALEDLYNSNNGYFSTQEEYLNAVRQVTNAWYAVNVGSPYNNEINPTIIGDLDICPGENTTLHTIGEYDGYIWSTGETTNSITVAEQGTYSVTLTHSDENGNDFCGYVGASTSVIFTPFIDLGADENGEGYHCMGTALDAGFGNGNYAYQWSTGATTQAIVPEQTGVYTVTVTDLETNCVNINSINMTHLWYLETELTGEDFLEEPEGVFRVCNFPVTLQISGDYDLSNSNNFLLYPVPINDPPAAIASSSEPSFQIQSAGRYRVRFRNNSTSNPNGFCSSESFITILGPVSSLQEIPDQNICSGDGFGSKFNINDYFTGAQSYTIKYENGQETEISDFSNYPITEGGEYTITAYENYCPTSESRTFNVNLTNLTVSIVIEGDEPYCGRATLTANSSSEDVTYQWFPSSINTGEKSITVENSGNYRVKIISTANQDCNAITEYIPVTIRSTPPQPSFTVEDLTNECGKKLELTSTYFFDTRTWFLDGEEVGTGTGNEYKNLTVKKAGIYTVQVTNQYGCTSTLSEATTLTIADLDPELDFGAAETDTDNWNDTFEGASTTTTMTSFTWNSNNGPDFILGPLVIPEGVELNISNKTITFLDEYSGISVQKGGRLRLNRATLQAHECLGINWKGLQVEGNPDVSHEIWYNEPSSTNLHPEHGIITVTDGSIIRDATIGIHSYLVNDVVIDDSDPNNVIVSNIGGGFIHVEGGLHFSGLLRNKFINNKIAIQIDPHDAVQRSLIAHTDFINEAIFPNDYTNSWAGEYKHIVLDRASRNIDGQMVGGGGLHIYGNTFSTDDDSGLNGVARGIGIVAIQTNITIGKKETNDSFDSNVFTNLDKGIDIYSTASLKNVANVIDNDFYNNHHAITLNTTPTAIVSANYIELPTVATENYPAHGIFIKQSFALKMEGNRLVSKDIHSSSGVLNNQVKGIVFQDCFKAGEFDSHIDENRFEGAIGAGTQFEGNSQGIQLFCNKYLEDGDTQQVPLNDWFLPKESESGTAMGENTIISVQGDCDGDEGVFSMFWQDWHTTNNFPNRRHIYNLAAHTVELDYGGIESKPIVIEGADDGVNDVSLQACAGGSPENELVCDEVFVAPPNDDGIVYTTPIYPPNPPHPPRPTGQCELTTKDIQYLLATHQVNEVLMDLACLNEIWSNKLLVNTYAANDDEQTARFYLNRIPQNTAENVEFHQLYEAVWNGQIHQVEDISNNITSSNAALAQAHLAVLRGDIYSRKSTPLEENHNSSKRNSNILESHQDFTIYPNPSNVLIHVNWKGIDNVLFHIYDMNGKLIFSKYIDPNQNRINIEDLQAGIYYCRIQDMEKVEKLVIIR